ncbi:hypothetical protein Gotri_026600 [Gossypium trilobum]|uniref:Uncharacterized protein n=1 Tax=Gossypium trilobum TaxID=34281 RepID=A0A7J9FNR3_9ROSI|nr:hypothetical protein [Gossypium trilobum]
MKDCPTSRAVLSIGGYGAIVRDDHGFVLGGRGDFTDAGVSVQEVECLAFEKKYPAGVSVEN